MMSNLRDLRKDGKQIKREGIILSNSGNHLFVEFVELVSFLS